jgi:hypothetical protein
MYLGIIAQYVSAYNATKYGRITPYTSWVIAV